MRPVLSRLAALVAIPLVAGCAYVTPYASTFPDHGQPAARTTHCDAALSNPAIADDVMTCLEARGWQWEVRGLSIRRQAGVVGNLSIPAAAVGIGLTASHDRSDVVPVLGLLSGAALTHTNAYARADQAQIYELASESYRCLVSGVVDWKSSGRSVLDEAYADFEAANDAALDALAATVQTRSLSASDEETVQAALLSQRAAARIALSRVDGRIGLALLRQSNKLEGDIRRAIGDRLPDPQAVARAVAQGTSAPAAKTPPVAPVAPTPAETAATGQNFSPSVSTFQQRVLAADRAAAVFDAALAEYSHVERTVALDCAFNPSPIPALSAPSPVTLSNGIGGFILRGGTAPYGYLPLPTGVSVIMSPLTAGAAHVEVRTTSAAGAGPWTLQFTDASINPSQVAVVVTGNQASPPQQNLFGAPPPARNSDPSDASRPAPVSFIPVAPGRSEPPRPLQAPVPEVTARSATGGAPSTDWTGTAGHEAWTTTLVDAVATSGQNLWGPAAPSDIATYCPSYGTASEADRKAFWVGLISHLARYESAFDPTRSFVEQDILDAQRRPVVSRGLLQISIESANGYGCGIQTEEALHVPDTNLRCGVRIMNRLIGRDGVISEERPDRWAGIAAYWSPFRRAEQRARIAEWARALPMCRA